jgi:hypothetical protein
MNESTRKRFRIVSNAAFIVALYMAWACYGWELCVVLVLFGWGNNLQVVLKNDTEREGGGG